MLVVLNDYWPAERVTTSDAATRCRLYQMHVGLGGFNWPGVLHYSRSETASEVDININNKGESIFFMTYMHEP